MFFTLIKEWITAAGGPIPSPTLIPKFSYDYMRNLKLGMKVKENRNLVLKTYTRVAGPSQIC